MTEHSKFWDGTSVGDAADATYGAPYDFGTEVAEMFSAIAGAEALAAKGGILRDVTTFHGTAMNGLALSIGVLQVTVNTGLALVYGSWYLNDAPVPIAISHPTGATRVDRIVLRKTWGTTQTVRLTRIAGVEGAGAPAIGAGTPAYTQTVGSTWDYEICQVSITTGDVITVTDSRNYLPYHGNQGSESGTKHAYSQISGTPSFSGTVTSVVPGAAGTAGASGALSDGAHQHPLVADPQAVSANNILAGTGGINDPDLVVTLPAAGTYRFTFMGPFQLNTGTSFTVNPYSALATALHYTTVGPDTTDFSKAITRYDTNGPFAEALAGSANMGVIVEGYVIVSGATTLLMQYAGVGGNIYRFAGAVLHARRLY